MNDVTSQLNERFVKTIELKHKQTIEINPQSPYNFDATVFKPAHYPDPLKIYETGRYWFAMRFENKIYGIKMKNQGTIETPKIKIVFFSANRITKEETRKLTDELNFRFEFNRDISEFYRKFKNDKILSVFLRKWRGMHGSCAQDLYGLLMISIFLQNTTVKRTVQMTNTMLQKYGIKIGFDNKEIFVFWKPEKMTRVSEEDIRKLNVGYRAKLLIRLSETFINEKIDELELRQMPVDAAKAKLMKIYGVGPETARIILQEALHHYDIFDHVAPWQQKIYSRLIFNKRTVTTERIIRYARLHWGKWAVLAVHYIWEDIFWQRKHGKRIDWLEKEIRL